jgi:hypothetical protein
MESPFRFSSELRDFVRENIEYIRLRSTDVRTLAKVLRLPNPNSLKEIEELYKRECIDQFRLAPDASWNKINDAYISEYMKIADSIPQRNRPEIDEKKREIKAELRRFMIAKFLQLNKFTASPEEVIQELNRILAEVES